MATTSKTICGNSAIELKKLQSGSIDLTVTSPPYDDIRSYNGYTFDWRTIIKELYRITKEGGVVVWVVADQTVNGSETGTSFKQALYAVECGFRLNDTMIWEKPFFSDVGSLQVRYAPTFEYMFIWSKGKPKTFNPIKDRVNVSVGKTIHGTIRNTDGTVKRKSTEGKIICSNGIRHNVWNISPVNSATERTGHPAQFPLNLAKDHIISWSNEGDMVLDPFLGSGTTRIAAYDLNRNFIGFEISEEYYKKQEERFAEHSAQLNIFQFIDKGE